MTGDERVLLTEGEREALNRAQFLTPPTLEDNPVHQAVEAILTARVREAEAGALEVAADEVRDRRTFGLREGERTHPTAEHFETWLRARAAALRAGGGS